MSYNNDDVSIYGRVQYTQKEKQLNLLKRYEKLLNRSLIKRDKKKYFSMLDVIRKEILRQGYDVNKSYIILCDYPIYKEISLVMMLLRDDTRASYNFMSAQEVSEVWWKRRGESNPSVALGETYMGIMDINQEVVNVYFGDIAYKMGKGYKIDSILAEFISRRMHSLDLRYGRMPVSNIMIKSTLYEYNNWPLYSALSNLTKDVTNVDYLGLIDLNGLFANTGYDSWYMGSHADLIPHLHDVSVMNYDISTKEDEYNSPYVSESIVPSNIPKENVDDIY